MNLQQLQQLALSAGFVGNDAAIAAAIAMAESGGNPSALCNSCAGVREYSVGLWQVNIYAWPRWTAAQLYDPTTNAQAAYTIWQTAGGFRPWSTFTSGAYLRYYKPLPGGLSGAEKALIAATAAALLVAGASAAGLLDAPARYVRRALTA